MSFEPEKYFIGVIDLFSVLLPGAVVAGMAVYFYPETQLAKLLNPDESAAAFLGFVAASYLVGSLLFVVGSTVDALYDWLRGGTDGQQVSRLVGKERKLSGWFPRALRWAFGKYPDDAIDTVSVLKNSSLERLEAANAMNTFQWSKLRLLAAQPQALALVNRFEADSKFVRSLLPVVPIVVAVSVQKYVASGTPKEPGLLVAATAALVLLPLLFWRYVQSRFKSTQQAYWAVLALEAEREVGARAFGPPARVRLKVDPGAFAGHPWVPVEWAVGPFEARCRERPEAAAVRECRSKNRAWARPAGKNDPREDGVIEVSLVLVAPLPPENVAWYKRLQVALAWRFFRPAADTPQPASPGA